MANEGIHYTDIVNDFFSVGIHLFVGVPLSQWLKVDQALVLNTIQLLKKKFYC